LISNPINYVRAFFKNRFRQSRNRVGHSGRPDGAFAQMNKGLQDMKRLHWELKVNLQAIEGQHQAIQSLSSEAWSEREQILSNYYGTLRGILLVFDNCENIFKSVPQISVVNDGLKRILEEQHIEPIQVKAGDLFDSEFHQCEETAEKEEFLNGAVLQIIEAGYIKKLQNGQHIVIRPAKVLVNKKMTHAEGETK